MVDVGKRSRLGGERPTHPRPCHLARITRTSRRLQPRRPEWWKCVPPPNQPVLGEIPTAQRSYQKGVRFVRPENLSHRRASHPPVRRRPLRMGLVTLGNTPVRYPCLMKGRKRIEWECDRCAMRLTTHIKLLEPPAHYCTGRDKNSNTNNRVPLQERRKR